MNIEAKVNRFQAFQIPENVDARVPDWLILAVAQKYVLEKSVMNTPSFLVRNGAQELLGYSTDWIVQFSEGSYDILTNDELLERYTIVSDE